MTRTQLVVQVVPYYPPHLGGMEVVAQKISEGLASRRSVEVLTSRCGRGASPVVERHGRLVVRRLATLELAHLPFTPGLLARLVVLPRDAVVHLHVAQAYVPEMVWLASRLRRRPFVAHFHLDVEPSGRFGRVFVAYKRRVLPHVLRAAARVIVLSDDQARFVRDRYQVPEARIAVIPNGVSDEFFRDPADRPAHDGPFRLLYVGRLAAQKNVSMLLAAMARLEQPAELVIVGDGDERAMLERLAGELGLDNVRFAGASRGDALVAWYHWADALVLTSEREGNPLVLLEAMASGLPVVATAVPGVVDTAAGSALLVPLDADAFAAAVDRVIRDAALRDDLAAHAYQRAAEFPWSRLLGTIEALYDEAASRR